MQQLYLFLYVCVAGFKKVRHRHFERMLGGESENKKEEQEKEVITIYR